jgi:hypothetical protein
MQDVRCAGRRYEGHDRARKQAGGSLLVPPLAGDMVCSRHSHSKPLAGIVDVLSAHIGSGSRTAQVSMTFRCTKRRSTTEKDTNLFKLKWQLVGQVAATSKLSHSTTSKLSHSTHKHPGRKHKLLHEALVVRSRRSARPPRHGAESSSVRAVDTNENAVAGQVEESGDKYSTWSSRNGVSEAGWADTSPLRAHDDRVCGSPI